MGKKDDVKEAAKKAAKGLPDKKPGAQEPCPGGDEAPPPPLSEDLKALCGLICACNETAIKKQWCVTLLLWRLDRAAGYESRFKAEVPYDMSKRPPAPYMSKNEPKRATQRRPLGSRIPDVVIVKDGAKPPTQGNIDKIVEIKFPGDKYSDGQERDYVEIAGSKSKLMKLTPEECGCGRRKKEQAQVTASAEATSLGKAENIPEPGALETLFWSGIILGLALDDFTGAGAADDVLIAPVAARLGITLTRPGAGLGRLPLRP